MRARSALKTRRGGLDLQRFEAEVLSGNVRAMRPLVRQAGVQTLDIVKMPAQFSVRMVPDGTGGDRALFTGYASVVDSPFTISDWLGDYTETVLSGSFTKTLGPPTVQNDRGAWSTRPDSVFVVNHDWDSIPMARTMAGSSRLREDSTGLLNEADLDPKRYDVAALISAIEGGELDAMSFAFWVIRQTWDENYQTRDIEEIDLDGGDTSVVTWPANPYTAGTVGLRSLQARALLSTKVPAVIVARARLEIRQGKTLSAATLETLQAMADLLGDAGDSHESALDLLNGLIEQGVDPADDGAGTDDGDGDESGDAPTGGESLDGAPPAADTRSQTFDPGALALARAQEDEYRRVRT